jgi:pSer/pThr/pTyr-binding forkhead associated (FHA) protein
MITCSNCKSSNRDNLTNCDNCSFPLFESEVDNPSINEQSNLFSLTDQHQKKYVLKVGKTKIGRSKNADIVVNDTFMSGIHAEIIIDKNKCLIKDLGSKNGTIVENQQISLDLVVLNPGNQIQCGSTRFIFLVTT